MGSVPASQVVSEALALRRSHPHAPAVDILDLVIRARGVWLTDLFEHMVPPLPFALLVYGRQSPVLVVALAALAGWLLVL